MLALTGWMRPLTTLFAGVVMFVATAPSAAQAPIDPTRRFRIASVASGMCWDVPNGVFRAGAVIQQYPCHDGENQQWAIHSIDAGINGGVIRSADNTNFCVTKNAADGLELQVCVLRRGGSAAQLWRISGFGINRRLDRLTNVQNSECADVPGGSLTPATLQTFVCNNGANQVWVLLPATP